MGRNRVKRKDQDFESKCVNHPNTFCHVCGQFAPPLQRVPIQTSKTIKSAFEAYFGCAVPHQDETWAPRSVCTSCYAKLRDWYKGKNPDGMEFSSPMQWSEPSNHKDDCYFCLANVTGLNSKGKKFRSIDTYPDCESARKPIWRTADSHVPIAPQMNTNAEKTLSGCDDSNIWSKNESSSYDLSVLFSDNNCNDQTQIAGNDDVNLEVNEAEGEYGSEITVVDDYDDDCDDTVVVEDVDEEEEYDDEDDDSDYCLEQTENVDSTVPTEKVSQGMLDDLVKDMLNSGLPISASEILGSRLKQWGVLEKGTKTSYRKRHNKFSRYYKMDGKYCVCHDIEGLFHEFEYPYRADEWRLFIDGGKKSLKAILLHNGNVQPSIPLVYAKKIPETRESISKILELCAHKLNRWKIIADLKIVTILQGLRGGWPKYGCYLCLWDSRNKNNWKECKCTLRTKEHLTKKYCTDFEPLVDPDMIILPPLHVKLGIIKQFVKAMAKYNPNGRGFKYLNKKFDGRLTSNKIKEGVFVGPQIRELMKDEEFRRRLNKMERDAWDSIVLVIENFLGNKKADNYEALVMKMLKAMEKMKCNLSLKLHFLRDHLEFFADNLGDFSDEQGERFHQDIFEFENRFTRKGDFCNLIGDYCWTLTRATDPKQYKRKSRRQLYFKLDLLDCSKVDSSVLPVEISTQLEASPPSPSMSSSKNEKLNDERGHISVQKSTRKKSSSRSSNKQKQQSSTSPVVVAPKVVNSSVKSIESPSNEPSPKELPSKLPLSANESESEEYHDENNENATKKSKSRRKKRSSKSSGKQSTRENTAETSMPLGVLDSNSPLKKKRRCRRNLNY